MIFLRKLMIITVFIYRIACMDRKPLDVWGLETSKSLQKVLVQTKTLPVVRFL